MPPKKKLTKEAIIDCAFARLRREGYESLNARALATELGCSTMPLFHHFGSMEEIRSAAVERAIALYSGYIHQGLAEPIPFKGVGKAYIRFAREEPQLFRLLFMMPDGAIPELKTGDPNYSAVAVSAQISLGSTAEQAERIYREMWIFVHGIATLAVTGTTSFTDEEISTMASDVFAGLKLREQLTNENKEKKEDG